MVVMQRRFVETLQVFDVGSKTCNAILQEDCKVDETGQHVICPFVFAMFRSQTLFLCAL
jgi:hypothetical protein